MCLPLLRGRCNVRWMRSLRCLVSRIRCWCWRSSVVLLHRRRGALPSLWRRMLRGGRWIIVLVGRGSLLLPLAGGSWRRSGGSSGSVAIDWLLRVALLGMRACSLRRRILWLLLLLLAWPSRVGRPRSSAGRTRVVSPSHCMRRRVRLLSSPRRWRGVVMWRGRLAVCAAKAVASDGGRRCSLLVRRRLCLCMRWWWWWCWRCRSRNRGSSCPSTGKNRAAAARAAGARALPLLLPSHGVAAHGPLGFWRVGIGRQVVSPRDPIEAEGGRRRRVRDWTGVAAAAAARHKEGRGRPLARHSNDASGRRRWRRRRVPGRRQVLRRCRRRHHMHAGAKTGATLRRKQ